jgi:hypothetical protein
VTVGKAPISHVIIKQNTSIHAMHIPRKKSNPSKIHISFQGALILHVLYLKNHPNSEKYK